MSRRGLIRGERTPGRRVCTGCGATHGGAGDNARRDVLASTAERIAHERGTHDRLYDYLSEKMNALYWASVVET